MEWAENVSKAMTKMPFHGVIMGRALRTFKPPNNTVGKLITWLQGGKLFSVQEHKNSNHLRMKKVSNYSREEICIIYFYYYLPGGEAHFEPKPKNQPSGHQPVPVQPQQPHSLPQPDVGEMETDNVQKKRDTSEAGINNNPEKKEKIAMMKKDIAFLQTYYINNTRNKIILDFSEDWRHGYDIMLASVRNAMNQEYQHRQRTSSHLFQISYKLSSPASAARNRCMQEQLVSEHPSPTTTGSEREEPRCSLADRDEWELKSDHYKKKADTYAAQIEDLETTLRGYKRANDSANDAANYYKDQVDHHLADLNSQVETNHRQSEADKAEIEELKTEIEKLKAENMALKQAQSEKPSGSKGNKTPGIFDNHPKRPSSTSPEKLMAIIDKQSFEMVEMKKKLAAAEEHVASLRREMQQVRTPETVVATKAGQCFHAHGCNHLLHGREQRAYVELRKCKDGLPWHPVAQSERQPEWVFHGQGWHAQIWEV